ncbi:hypothetical protein P9C50_05585 [Bacillus subtilis]|uniref:hypothetical protein n=1 Tax=Bacillus subtilis TaxID=1423 RepID=UPI002DBC1E91|nr:hypothetical protein [Bacillus subtilis]MEC1264178.1 hypothetical protein [Bacillus subtilis]
MKNDFIERAAVQAIRNEAVKPNTKLIANIPEGDKGVSFDGEIHVYNDCNLTVKSFMGSVRVQVKGKQVEKFSEEKSVYSLEIEHYENYLNNGGALFFLVEILPDGNSKIFYKHLLPIDLHIIITMFGNQKYRKMDLNPLSETNLYDICWLFISELDRQPKLLIEKEPKEVVKYEFKSLTTSREKLKENFQDIFNHDFYIYGTDKNMIDYPLGQDKLKSITYSKFIEYSFGTKKFTLYTKYRIEKTKRILFINNCLLLTIEGDKLSTEITSFGSLADQIIIVDFLINLHTDYRINCKEMQITFEENIKTNERKDDLKRTYEALQVYKNIFLNLDIDLSLNLGPITKELSEKLFILFITYYKKKYSILRFENPEKARFILHKLGRVKVALFYDPNGDEKLKNAFSTEVSSMKIILEKGNHTVYSLLDADFLAHAKNLNLEVIKKAFDSIDPFTQKSNFIMTKTFCENCIKGFDMSGNEKLLHLAKYICEKYSPDKNDSKWVILLKILCQIEYRVKGYLSEEYIEQLIYIKKNTEINLLLFGVNFLLQSKNEALLAFKKLTEDEKKMVRERLANKMV